MSTDIHNHHWKKIYFFFFFFGTLYDYCSNYLPMKKVIYSTMQTWVDKVFGWLSFILGTHSNNYIQKCTFPWQKHTPEKYTRMLAQRFAATKKSQIYWCPNIKFSFTQLIQPFGFLPCNSVLTEIEDFWLSLILILYREFKLIIAACPIHPDDTTVKIQNNEYTCTPHTKSHTNM